MFKLINSYHPFKKEKIKPSETPLESEKEINSETHKEGFIIHTCKTTPNNTNFMQDIIFPSYQNNKILINDIIQESRENKLSQSGNSSKIMNAEIKKDDTTEIMTYIRCLFHDFRSPLNNISMGIDILDDVALKENESQEIINNIKESCNFITNSLNDFLHIENILSGNTNEFIHTHNIDFNIVDSIKKTEKMMLYKIKSKKLHIEYDFSGISENYKNVYGDSLNLQHIFMNLLSNAVKFAESNTKIKIKLTMKMEKNKTQDNMEKIRYTYVIIDENKHIVPEIKISLFKKYNTSNITTGTGLGLYICKKIVENYDGNIEHDYQSPNGNIFKVDFVLCLGKLSVINDTSKKCETILSEGATGENTIFSTIPTIYIVDDSSISRKMLKTLITLSISSNKKLMNFNIIEESDGLELIKQLENTENIKNTNVIFIDNQMPILNGILSTKILRALGYKNYIIGITGNNENKEKEDFKKNGADYVFTKPITKEKINELLFILEKTSFQNSP